MISPLSQYVYTNFWKACVFYQAIPNYQSPNRSLTWIPNNENKLPFTSLLGTLSNPPINSCRNKQVSLSSQSVLYIAHHKSRQKWKHPEVRACSSTMNYPYSPFIRCLYAVILHINLNGMSKGEGERTHPNSSIQFLRTYMVGKIAHFPTC